MEAEKKIKLYFQQIETTKLQNASLQKQKMQNINSRIFVFPKVFRRRKNPKKKLELIIYKFQNKRHTSNNMKLYLFSNIYIPTFFQDKIEGDF